VQSIRHNRPFAAQHLRRLPIARESGLYLNTSGHGDDTRFARLFAAVWRQIPSGYRRRMLAHWHPRRGQRFRPRVSPPVPSIECLACPVKEPRGDVALSHCTSHGDGLSFAGPDLDRMPDAAVRWVIAHALAHVIHYATGYETPRGEEDEFWYEVYADELAWDGWDFDPGPFDAWCLAQIEQTGTTPAA
jgi:hypothetical protein